VNAPSPEDTSAESDIGELPEEVAEAWAAVLIDIYERRRDQEVEHVEHRAAG
jgi:hypothetical protein